MAWFWSLRRRWSDLRLSFRGSSRIAFVSLTEGKGRDLEGQILSCLWVGWCGTNTERKV